MMRNVIYKTNANGYPNADAVMERGVLLPLHHGMKDSMFERLHESIEEFVNLNN
jgi:CDP-6-deoxy-D-xylo-4-hexulose-3-dehydrase